MNYVNTLSRHMELLAIHPGGKLQACSDDDQNGHLQNTLFNWLYPEGHLARLSVRSMDAYNRHDLVGEMFDGIWWAGIRYLPIGSLKSIANQEIVLVDEVTCNAITTRFQDCGQTLISQSDLLISPCEILTELEDLRIMVIPNAVTGRNDWLGWIRRSTFSRLGFPAVSARYPFVMAFESTQAKGEISIMDDTIADRHQADIIIPKKCLKPHPRPGSAVLPAHGRLVSRVVLGIQQNSKGETYDQLGWMLDQHVCNSSCTPFIWGSLRCLLMRAFPVHAFSELQEQ